MGRVMLIALQGFGVIERRHQHHIERIPSDTDILANLHALDLRDNRTQSLSDSET
jgi:hypothetical protein